MRNAKAILTRLAALILILCLLCAGVCAHADEIEEALASFDEEMLFRFGMAESIVKDDQGEPVLVNGYPLRSVEAAYFDSGQMKDFSFQVDFLDYPFWRPSTEYDGNLAVMSLAMALSSSRPASASGAEGKVEDPARNLEQFLTEAGFTDIRKDDYSKATSMYTVSTGIGQRRMEAEGQEPFTLIAIGICGSGYKNEWQSNLTPGEGDIHAGFQGAAQLVVDRLSGYIITHKIEGRIKVWLSGFSRAAAVSNLTAAALTDTDLFAREDIYAYTFATPAAIKDPPASGYEHIYNIICPADLIPQVMPAEWGYSRYGTDIFLAVEEFSSFLGGAASLMRQEKGREIDVINQYSPHLNFRMRLLYSLLLEVIGSKENYNRIFQPALVGIMQNKTLPNTLTTLQQLMLNMKDGDSQQLANTDDLLDYFIRVFSSSIMRSGLGATDTNTANAMFRLFNEHNENSYLVNVTSIRLGLFCECTDMCYVMVRGPVSLTISGAETEVFDEPICSISAEGVKSDIAEEGLSKYYYMERHGEATVIAVPRDFDYTVTWTAEGSGRVECLTAGASVLASTAYPGWKSRAIAVQAGDSGIAFRQENGQIVAPEGFDEKTFDAVELAGFMGIVSLGVNWRIAVVAGCGLIGLIVCAALCLIASRKPSRRKRYGFLCWFALCLFGVAVLETEIAYWLFADRPLIRALWKIIVAACLLFLMIRVHPKKKRLAQSLFPALLLAVIADSVISFHFIAGAGIYLLCHIALIVCLLRRAPLSRKRWIQWALLSLPLAALIAVYIAPVFGEVGWTAVVFIPALLLMGFCLGKQPPRVRFGAAMFIASDCLLALFTAFLNIPIIHAVYMFLYYFALLLFAIAAEEKAEQEALPGDVQSGVSA